MKKINIYILRYFILFLLIFTASCEDFLKEESISEITSESYYKSEEGFEDLVKSCYPLLRDIIQQRNLVLLGTDIFTSEQWDEVSNSGNLFNLYDVRLNSSVSDLESLWDLLYKEISRTNTVISRKDGVVYNDGNLKEVRVAEAKFLRALSYFYLVQQWGDIPMPLVETTTANKQVERIPAATVYTQIITDLTEAEDVLTEQVSDYGRVTKGAARFLLARVYLTRGWNYNNSLGGSAGDFDKALQYADQVIEAYPLAENYKELFPQHAENPLEETFPEQNPQNPEIVLAVQFSDDVLTYVGDPTNPNAIEGNDYHSIFGGGIEDMPGQLGRSSEYNRHLSLFVTTPAMYRLYDPQLDTRYQFNFVDAIYALSDVDEFTAAPGEVISINRGDTVALYRPWNDPAEGDELGLNWGGTKSYSVINTDSFAIHEQTTFHYGGKHPLMWKFWEPGIPYGDGYGTFDFALFRSAEAYLIAAEAIVKGAGNGNLGGAHVYYNMVLDRALGENKIEDPSRAAVPEDVSSLDETSYRATAGNIDIDMILDERARELMGEYVRWYDLKRTGKLIERVSKYNPWASLKGQIKDYHLLRPLPQHELDRSSVSVPQNPGY